jgi:uncharacterized protein RhaS with RHS repeats
MQARYYDPVIGRFYSNDPVDSMGHLDKSNIHGFNRYNYVNNNPYRFIDPDGKFGLPFNFGTKKKNNEGAEVAREMQKTTSKAVSGATTTVFDGTSKTAEIVHTVTPGGAAVKTATAVITAAVKASDTDKPVETFVKEVAVELIGDGIGKKVDTLTKNVDVNDTAKEINKNIAADTVKSTIREEIDEDK